MKTLSGTPFLTNPAWNLNGIILFVNHSVSLVARILEKILPAIIGKEITFKYWSPPFPFLYFFKYEHGSQKCSSPIIEDTRLNEISNAVVYTTERCSVHELAIWGKCAEEAQLRQLSVVAHLWAGENVLVSVVKVCFSSMTVANCTWHSRPETCYTYLVIKHLITLHTVHNDVQPFSFV